MQVSHLEVQDLCIWDLRLYHCKAGPAPDSHTESIGPLNVYTRQISSRETF